MNQAARGRGITGRFVSSIRGSQKWPLALLAGLSVLLFLDCLVGGKVLLMRDTFFFYLPNRILGRQAVLDGALPLWNHFSGCGQPYLASPDLAFFYPLHLPFYLLPPTVALHFSFALHTSVAAAGCYLLCRAWGLAPWPGLLAGVAFSVSSCLVGMWEFHGLFTTAVWLPWQLLMTDKVIASCRSWGSADTQRSEERVRWAGWVAGLILVMTCAFLAGYLQVFLFQILLVGAYLATRLAASRDWPLMLRVIASFSLASVLTIGLCMPQILPTLELIEWSKRSASIDPELDLGSLHPRLLLTWLLPFLAGRPGYGAEQWWGEKFTQYEFWVGTGYVGAGTLVLISFAFLWFFGGPGKDGQRLRVIFLTVAAAVALFIAMGKYTPVYMGLYEFVPLFDRVRWPSKIVYLTVFCLAMLSGFGLQAILTAKDSGRGRQRKIGTGMLIAWGAICLLMAAGLSKALGSPDFFTWLTGGAFQHREALPERFLELARDYASALMFLTASILTVFILWRRPGYRRWLLPILVMLVFADLYRVSRSIQFRAEDNVYTEVPRKLLREVASAEPRRTATTYEIFLQQSLYGARSENMFRFAQKAMVGESSLRFNVFKGRGGANLEVSHYWQLYRNLFGVLNPNQPEWWRLASALNIGFLVDGPSRLELLKVDGAAEARVVSNPECLPRALVVDHWKIIPDENLATRALLQGGYDPYRSVILDRFPGIDPEPGLIAEGGSPRTALSDAGIDSIAYDWNRVDLTVRAERPSVLVLNDVWYPGWKALVDGKEQPILRANVIFRGIQLTPGTHQVSFVYRPWQVPLGLAIGLLALMVMAGGMILICLRAPAKLS